MEMGVADCGGWLFGLFDIAFGAGPTFADARHLVAQHVDRVHAAVLLEHLAQLVLVHRLGHLSDEHLDVVRIGLLAGERAQCLRRVAEVVVDGEGVVVVVAGDAIIVATANKAAIVAHVHSTENRKML